MLKSSRGWGWRKLTVTHSFVIFVRIEIGHADDDERNELINSLSGNHDVHLDVNPQGTAWVTRGCGSGARKLKCMIHVKKSCCQVWTSVVLYLLCGYFTPFICNALLSQTWNSIPSRVNIPTIVNTLCVMIVQIFYSYWQRVIEGLLRMQKLVRPRDVQPQLTWHPTVSAAVACGHKFTFHQHPPKEGLTWQRTNSFRERQWNRTSSQCHTVIQNQEDHSAFY